MTETLRGNFLGKELLIPVKHLSEGDYFCIKMKYLIDFLSYHGFAKNKINLFIRSNLPGARTIGLWSGPKDHLIEAFEVISKFGAGYQKPKKEKALLKPEKMALMEAELQELRFGKGITKRKWCPLGGKGDPI